MSSKDKFKGSVCEFFKQGTCVRGKKCRFAHIAEPVAVSSPRVNPVAVTSPVPPPQPTNDVATPTNKPVQMKIKEKKVVTPSVSAQLAAPIPVDPAPRTVPVYEHKYQTPIAPAPLCSTPALLEVPRVAVTISQQPATASVPLPATQNTKRKAEGSKDIANGTEKKHKAAPPHPRPNSAQVKQLPAVVPVKTNILRQLVQRTLTSPRFDEFYSSCLNKAGTAHPGWVDTTAGFSSSPGGSRDLKVIGLDCEMIDAIGDDRALARVTIVTLGYPRPAQGPSPRVVLLDGLLNPPDRKVLNYRTSITGLTEKSMGTGLVFKSLAEVQAEILKYVSEDTVIVGHGLNHDLCALKIVHKNVIDTALMYSLEGTTRQLLSLKDLVEQLLGERCQPDGEAHNSIEDAAWPLEIIRNTIDQFDDAVIKGGVLPNKAFNVTMPEHFTRRLNVFQLDERAQLSDVTFALAIDSGIQPFAREISIRSSSRPGQPKRGSTVIEFKDKNHAIDVFEALPEHGMKTDLDGLFQKKVWLDQQKFPGADFFWVKTYNKPRPKPKAVLSPASKVPPTILSPAPTTSSASLQFCVECGAKAPVANAKFCGKCGTTLVVG